jgi:hypothetical protein
MVGAAQGKQSAVGIFQAKDIHSYNEKSQITEERLYSEERKNIRNHEKVSRT